LYSDFDEHMLCLNYLLFVYKYGNVDNINVNLACFSRIRNTFLSQFDCDFWRDRVLHQEL